MSAPTALTITLVLCLGLASPSFAAFSTFETGQVRPLALSPDGERLFAVNTPDGRMEVLDVGDVGLTHAASVRVGLEPVAVAARSDGEVWVVNHLSDSVSIVDVAADPPRVVRTLLVGDEPRDIVFAGPNRRRAFITTAHRGQHRPGDPQLTTPGIGRADVWVFDTDDLGAALGGTPLTIVTLFTDTPRALAVTADGATVFAAGFHTGNRTTAIHDGLVCDGGAAVGPCTVSGHTMPGGLPAPNTNAAGVPQPEVGLILQHDGDAWRDAVGRDWSAAVRFSLPDRDLFRLDAMATPPIATGSVTSVGTILFDLAVDQVSGTLYVANTEARNTVRFEGPGVSGGSTVRGRLHEARISIVRPDGSVLHRHLNKHLTADAGPPSAATRERSLATPAALALTADGRTLYVAAFGSSKVGVFDTITLADDSFVPDAANHIELAGGGPSGLVLDEPRRRLYVLTRFDDAVVVVDTASRREIQRRRLFNPEPPTVVAGRRFLYDARLTSSNGEASCAACHVYGDLDSLAWDLGDPDGGMLQNRNPLRPGLAISPDFHPMKGPMTTQSLRGMSGHGPLHWRGDRTGGLHVDSVPPDAGAYDERAGFLAFNPAFVGLLGREAPLTGAEMEAFADFAMQIRYPPNPNRPLDGGLTVDQAAGRAFFFDADPSDVSGPCNVCHVLDPSAGLFGTDGHSVVEPQGAIKIPHLRNAYQKVGMFGMPHVPSPLAGFGFNATNHVFSGEQVRGFGFTHDGSVDTIFRFLHTRGFNRSAANPAGFTVDPAGDVQRRQVEQFVLGFDSDFAPIVGQQVSVGAADPDTARRVGLLVDRAEAGDCDLVVSGVAESVSRGWSYVPSPPAFLPDRESEAATNLATLLQQAASAGEVRTFTCVPPGSGRRIGIDRDEDGYRDQDELDAGSSPTDPHSTPRDFDPVRVVRGRALELRDDSPGFDRPRARRIRLWIGRTRDDTGIAPAPFASVGDPTQPGSSGGGVLAVYNVTTGGDVVEVTLPADRWQRRGTARRPRGYRYRDPTHTAGPIARISLSPKGRLVLSGGGRSWPYDLDEHQQGRVAVRLQLGRGIVWCAVFTARPSRRAIADAVGRFDGIAGLPLPEACPPMPSPRSGKTPNGGISPRDDQG